MIWDWAYVKRQAELNRRFAEYLDGKTVAIVGRANLHQLEQGEFIDSHDVVVRVHGMIPYAPTTLNIQKTIRSYVPDGWKSIIGSRVDILYHRIGFPKQSERSDDVPESFVKEVDMFWAQGGQFICHENPKPFPLRYALLNVVAEVRYLDLELYNHLTLKFKRNTVNPGIVIIADILSHSIKSAYITGFPCYFDDVVFDMNHASLRSLNELRFLRDLSKHQRVTFDPLMHELFEAHCT